MSNQKQNPSVAVLLSTYNGEKYIELQLESLSRQTYPFSLYVRDDGSTDTTMKILNKWSDTIDINILPTKDNLGPAKSFWKLLEYPIEAEAFLFCDQDDIWDDNKIRRCIDELNKGACLTFCNCRIIDSEGNLVQEKRLKDNPDISYERLFINGVTQGCSMCITRELRDYILSCDIKCIPMHDIIVMLYAKEFGKITWIDEPLFSYRIHGSNVVAKDGNPIRRLRKSFKNWNESRKNSLSDVASELLRNCNDVDENEYLIAASRYKSSVTSKIRMLRNKKLNQVEKDAKRSYLGRVMIGWL